MCEKQTATLLDPTPQGIIEGFLKQKAKVHWLNVRDRNNVYFRRIAQMQKTMNTIREVVDKNGEVLTSMDDIKRDAVRYFEEFLIHKPDKFRVT